MNTVAKYFCQTIGLALSLIILLTGPGLAAKRTGPVVVPENGYANGYSYGIGWDCSFGYQKDAADCIAVDVPANAYLNSIGTGWQCMRGYHSVGFARNECLQISVPADGYLTESKSRKGWACNRGFTATGDGCESIRVPDNAYLTNSLNGSGWECARGYRAASGGCILIPLPDNAYLVTKNYGPGWQCARGYNTADDKTCSKLDVPENGHLNNSGNEWQCNKPYVKRGKTCIKT
jgi:hypothetical protein